MNLGILELLFVELTICRHQRCLSDAAGASVV